MSDEVDDRDGISEPHNEEDTETLEHVLGLTDGGTDDTRTPPDGDDYEDDDEYDFDDFDDFDDFYGFDDEDDEDDDDDDDEDDEDNF